MRGASVLARYRTFTVTRSPSMVRWTSVSGRSRPLDPITASSTSRIDPPTAATRAPSRSMTRTGLRIHKP
jgi:hypothetical protein